jgi:hypothetical protein
MNERTTRSRVQNNSHFAHPAFVATFEPKDMGDTLSDHNWVNSMHEELDNFERNQVWESVDPPLGCKPIGAKWVLKNKKGEKGEVVGNKSRLVAQGFSQSYVREVSHECADQVIPTVDLAGRQVLEPRPGRICKVQRQVAYDHRISGGAA